jgi:hypothetical protein
MAKANSWIRTNGTWLVVSFLAVAMLLVIISRVYRAALPPPKPSDIWEEQGAPAARRGMALSQEGRKLLPMEEQREVDTLYTEAMQTLTPGERQQFTALVQKNEAATAQEIAESGQLIGRAINSLPPEKRERLFLLVKKSVQLAQQQEATASPQP